MADDVRIRELNERHGLPGVVKVERGNGGLGKIRGETSLASAEIYLYGAQMTSWKPAGFEEVLFVSKESHWQMGKAIRGGIPVCFPWFRGKADDKQAPTHGLVRTKEWSLNSVQREPDDSISVRLSTESDSATGGWWPYEFRLEYAITFGKSLNLELRMQNTGRSELLFQEALHTYFSVGDVRRAKVRGLEGVRYLDNRDENHEKVRQGELVFSKQTDNAYLDATGAIEIVDSVLGRRLVTEKQGSISTIVWNPWKDGAAQLADLGNDEWQQMVCVEGGNVLGQAVTLAPGDSHTMAVLLKVLPE